MLILSIDEFLTNIYIVNENKNNVYERNARYAFTATTRELTTKLWDLGERSGPARYAVSTHSPLFVTFDIRPFLLSDTRGNRQCYKPSVILPLKAEVNF